MMVFNPLQHHFDAPVFGAFLWSVGVFMLLLCINTFLGKNIALLLGSVNCLMTINSLDRRRRIMIPGLIMWLLGVPLVVIILLFVFRVI